MKVCHNSSVFFSLFQSLRKTPQAPSFGVSLFGPTPKPGRPQQRSRTCHIVWDAVFASELHAWWMKMMNCCNQLLDMYIYIICMNMRIHMYVCCYIVCVYCYVKYVSMSCQMYIHVYTFIYVHRHTHIYILYTQLYKQSHTCVYNIYIYYVNE
jgi:hypothetical protein